MIHSLVGGGFLLFPKEKEIWAKLPTVKSMRRKEVFGPGRKGNLSGRHGNLSTKFVKWSIFVWSVPMKAFPLLLSLFNGDGSTQPLTYVLMGWVAEPELSIVELKSEGALAILVGTSLFCPLGGIQIHSRIYML